METDAVKPFPGIKTAERPGEKLPFVGQNPSFDPNRNASLKEQAAIKRQLKSDNRDWLSQHFRDLLAAWLMVVDGQVLTFGAALDDYPTSEQILEVCHRTGKFPFINEKALAIEESTSLWHPTKERHDAYPTVSNENKLQSTLPEPSPVFKPAS